MACETKSEEEACQRVLAAISAQKVPSAQNASLLLYFLNNMLTAKSRSSVEN